MKSLPQSAQSRAPHLAGDGRSAASQPSTAQCFHCHENFLILRTTREIFSTRVFGRDQTMCGTFACESSSTQGNSTVLCEVRFSISDFAAWQRTYSEPATLPPATTQRCRLAVWTAEADSYRLISYRPVVCVSAFRRRTFLGRHVV